MRQARWVHRVLAGSSRVRGGPAEDAVEPFRPDDSTLDALVAHVHARSLDGATLSELDGAPIVRRPRRPIGIGRAVLAICATIAVDLVLRLLSVLPAWSDFASNGALPMTLTSMVAGVVTFLVLAAFMRAKP